jgi:hypothetical protein
MLILDKYNVLPILLMLISITEPLIEINALGGIDGADLD